MFINEQGKLEHVNNLYTFTLNAESALRMGVSQILVALINDAKLYDVQQDVELEIMRLPGTVIYYCKKEIDLSPAESRFYHFPVELPDPERNAKLARFKDFFWANPDKPQVVPRYVLASDGGYRHTPQQIKALSSDLIIHPEADTPPSNRTGYLLAYSCYATSYAYTATCCGSTADI